MDSEAAAFLEVADQFRLGDLETEQPHPGTLDLAAWSREDLPRAIEAIREVDLHALATLRDRAESLHPLAEAIRETLSAGDRVFLCGCGATGRLSLSLELFCRAEEMVAEEHREQVRAFMAGGDAALIRSIERFEDRPDFGERQLRDLGFAEGDLLVASTEAGETPFVIGATELAARFSRREPFFLYGNPDEILRAKVERSRRVIENPKIRKINLSTGPMALSGSTRMQASTILMLAIGSAFLSKEGSNAVGNRAEALMAWWKSVPDLALAAFIEEEAAIYQKGEFVIYEPGPYGMTVLTDTTERSPTFALVPFENSLQPDDPVSLCYLHLTGSANPAEAWRTLLHRDPRPLAWGTLSHLTGKEAIEGFDFSDGIFERRKRSTQGAAHHRFRIGNVPAGIQWKLKTLKATFPCAGLEGFGRHLALKMLLNTHSTLVMGRLGRYEDNVMTYVSASNNKLVDRAVRYTRQILERRQGHAVDYETVVSALFEERRTLRANESIVLRLVDRLSSRA